MSEALASVADLWELLGRNANELIGQAENEWLDFKLEPYQLDANDNAGREKARLELAKDVSAFANEEEGVILLGVRTEKQKDSQMEIAVELRPPPNGMVNPEQIRSVIREWTFPPLEVRIANHKVPGTDRLLVSIYVRPQHDRDKPFVVARELIGERGASRNLFGVYHRAESDNVPYPIEQVWTWINRGFNAPARETSPPLVAPPDADQALEVDVKGIGLDPKESFHFLQVMTQPPARLERFYEGARDSLYDRLLRINHLRPGGFNLPDGFDPVHADTGALRETWEGNDSLSVIPTGLTTAVHGQRHLTWAYERMAPREEIWINPVALVEFTLEFWRFYIDEVTTRMEESIASLWRTGMRHLIEPQPLYLPGGFYRGAERHSAQADSIDTGWQTTHERDPGKLAYAVLSRIYSQFAFDEALIPCVKDERVSEQMIRDIKRGG